MIFRITWVGKQWNDEIMHDLAMSVFKSDSFESAIVEAKNRMPALLETINKRGGSFSEIEMGSIERDYFKEAMVE